MRELTVSSRYYYGRSDRKNKDKQWRGRKNNKNIEHLSCWWFCWWFFKALLSVCVSFSFPVFAHVFMIFFTCCANKALAELVSKKEKDKAKSSCKGFVCKHRPKDTKERNWFGRVEKITRYFTAPPLPPPILVPLFSIKCVEHVMTFAQYFFASSQS